MKDMFDFVVWMLIESGLPIDDEAFRYFGFDVESVVLL